MYTKDNNMYMEVVRPVRTAASKRRNKHLILDQTKLTRAKKVLGARTETETIERALDRVISEEDRNRRAWAATEKLIRSGVGIGNVVGSLGEE